ncbi:MAG: nucleotide disphospho-sugar-binding domain-containing protein [Kofleriaceae bacterium]
MARLLVATVPLTGHVHPMRMVVQELIARGHEIVWCGGRRFEASIVATGARFVATERDFDDRDVEAALPALRRKRGLRRVKTQLREMFIAPMADQLRELEAICEQFVPAAILADSAHLGAMLLSEKHAIPWVGLGISAIVVPSLDTAPFGSALPPGDPEKMRPRNRVLNHVIFRWVFAGTNRAFRRGRVAAGLPAGNATYFDVMSPHLFLQPTIEAFEYPRSDLPSQVRFIGPLVPRDPATSLPAWWPELLAAHRAGTPIVLVTQGTLATDPRELVMPTLAALADLDVFVVATIAGEVAAPVNARVAEYLPYQALLPMCAAMVTNGGYGGVQMALAHGVPMIVAGGSEEKPEIAARVAWSGTGIDLRTRRVKASKMRIAVERVLAEPRFRDRARALGELMSRSDARATAATLIEELAGYTAAVKRSA